MSLSYENVCSKCGKQFDAWCHEDYCDGCADFVKIKDLPDDFIIRVSDYGGYSYACIEAKYVKSLGTAKEENFSKVKNKFPLGADEINAVENMMGHKLIFKER